MNQTITLCLLLALVTGGLLWQTNQRGKDSVRNDELSRELKSTGEIMGELRAIKADVTVLLAQRQAEEQQRNVQGEIRREQMREATKNDTCANTVVPVAVSNSLQKRTASTTVNVSARTGAGKPDSRDAAAGTGKPRYLGRNSQLE
ncbi:MULTISPECIES: DUF2570 domain-containing protein [Citrobacter freundii complex]|uniref:DUF2570 domain-containing protein n=1 Tax=Citrobacter freundii complex TaxID=1344959 RepID=UPI000F518090|nr:MULTISPECIES: DUF2570 domain-containing protein [Citrobacter freundii complex]MCQ7058329.1 DUF2570 domain-containing protein [Escherichia coli]MEB0976224.1 DUF2570 domain-containing protein [Citrobacter freundii]RPH25993.1 DUF2570 domain-containing protein [Citrobacter youngae]VEI42992.1 prophage lipoprotein [Citrobacter youngae]